MHDLHGWAPQATQVSNQWRQDGQLIAGAKVSAGLSPAGSWYRQTGMFSRDTGLMRPYRNAALYLAEDPEERNDLSAQMPDKVAEMSARMDEYLAEAKDIDVAYVTSSVQAAFSYGGIWSPGWCDASVFG